MVTRCLENHVFSVTANRIGSEKRGGKRKLTYIGTSEIVNPLGKILHRAPEHREKLAVIDIHPEEARDKALNPYNDLLRDRRRALYQA
jgi:predicted amidohydrolase